MVLSYGRTRKSILKSLLIISFLLITLSIFSIYQMFSYIVDNCEKSPTIDVVYTWVNGTDPAFIKNLQFHLEQLTKSQRSQIDTSPQRYTDHDELKYSLRSLEQYAPWINHVYIVTNGQIPNWLDLNYDKITIVTHKEIFNINEYLPTFSSPAIEAHLHRIPGLSENFIYFNDDIFLQSPIYSNDFLSDNRGYLIYLSWPLMYCNEKNCLWNYIGDGNCDLICMTNDCQYDGGDCDHVSQQTQLQENIDKNNTKRNFIDNDFDKSETNYDKFMKLLQQNQSGNHLNIIDYFRQSFNNNLNKISEFVEEHNRRIVYLNKRNRKSKLINNNNNDNIKFNIDTFGKSLQYTNRILNHKYGIKIRKVPAHAPILINKKIIKALQDEFIDEITQTIRNRFRNFNDFQYSFSYYYYVINKKQQLDIDEIFNEFDTDRSGQWSSTELRTVLTKLYDLPLNDQVFGHFWSILLNCSHQQTLTRITKDLITNCTILSKILQNTIGIRNKYNFEIIENADNTDFVTFKMLTSDKNEVLELLDNVRKYPKKFVCLNDNMDPNRWQDNEIIKEIMYDFYQSMFPYPSKFELISNNMDDSRQFVIRISQIIFNFINLLLILYLIYLLLLICRRFRNRLCSLLNYFLFLN